jgi:hypothetical protein
MLHIFDFDDTLVFTNGGKLIVPRQIFHKLIQLKNNNHSICIISFNPLVKYYANRLYLEYCDIIHYEDNDRYKLVEFVLRKFNMDNNATFFYYDDRNDNIENVKKHYQNTVTHHVQQPEKLHKCIRRNMMLSINEFNTSKKCCNCILHL